MFTNVFFIFVTFLRFLTFFKFFIWTFFYIYDLYCVSRALAVGWLGVIPSSYYSSCCIVPLRPLRHRHSFTLSQPFSRRCSVYRHSHRLITSLFTHIHALLLSLFKAKSLSPHKLLLLWCNIWTHALLRPSPARWPLGYRATRLLLRTWICS